MEIDFLGLKSGKYTTVEDGSRKVFTDTAGGGVETSLCLSSTSSLDSHKEIVNFSERKKAREFPGREKMIPSSSGCLGPSGKMEQPGLLLVATPGFHHSPAAGFLYDLNNAASTNSRKMPQPQDAPASLAMLYSRCPTPNLFTHPQKTENTIYKVGNASTTKLSQGYTPTVAMARRATLARFLEKRLHRMNQVRTSPLMGKSVKANDSEACEASIGRSNNKNINLKRR